MLNRKRAERTPTSNDTSLIARGTFIRGDVNFSGTLHLDGRVEGTVLAEGDGAVFTLSENGIVQGEIRVPHAIINGQVHGNVYASDRLELAPDARINGDVHYRTLEMAAGAQINGRMSHTAGEPVRQLAAPLLTTAEALPA